MTLEMSESVETPTRMRLLVVEDEALTAVDVRALLQGSDAIEIDVDSRSWAEWSIDQELSPHVDVVLLGTQSHAEDDLIERVDSVRRVSRAAIVLIADNHDQSLLVRGLAAGADAILTRTQTNREQWLHVLTSSLHVRRRVRRLQLELECAVHMNDHDRITNLQNRHSLERRLAPLLATAERSGRKLGVLFVEVGGLKSVNDSFGFNAGNQLLSDVADRLARSVRQGDDVTRCLGDEAEAAISHLGGSEFTIMLSEISNSQDAALVARRIIDALSGPFSIDPNEIFVNTSIGIAVYPLDGDDADILLRNAGSAKMRAKHTGGNAFRFYTKSMNSEAARRLRLEGLLHRALERDEFTLHYQPLRDATSGRVLAVEALLRWTPEELGVVSPAEFVPIAEGSDLIVPIGEWVLRAASEQHRRWCDAGYEAIRLAVNLSGRQLKRGKLAEMVSRVLSETGMSSSHLELEITETTIMNHDEQTKTALSELRDMGVGLALDDFGTGFSTLTHLSSFPVDRLKIDRSFISEIGGDSQGSDIASALIAMAHSLDLVVVAEGVETEEQANFLRQHGCDELQGYLLGRPVPAVDFERFLDESKKAT